MAKSNRVCNYSQVGKKEVSELIKAAFGGVKKARELVQVAAVGVLLHATKCGDWSFAATLVDGLDNSTYNASLVAWFVKFGGLVVTKDKETGEEKFTGWQGADYIESHYQTAMDNAWWEEKKQAKAYTGFDLQSEVLKLIARATREQKAAKANAEKAPLVHIDDTLLYTLKGLVSVDPLIVADSATETEQAKAA